MVRLESAMLHSPNESQAKAMLDADNAVTGQGPSALLQATQAPMHEQIVSAMPLAANVAMPSAQQLAGLNNASATGQHNQVVAQVLVDALHGGGQGSTIDAVINSLPTHGGAANDSLGSLSSHGGGGVSIGDMGIFAGFSGAHMGLSMEHAMQMVHQDAAPLHG
jgi:hypothetical protein